MTIVLFNLFILAVTAALPWIVDQVHPASKQSNKKWYALTLLAGILFPLAQVLPNIHISHETSTFQQHAVGGGAYCALLYTYFKQRFGWRTHWLLDLALFFAFVSALGVANELLEFFLVKVLHDQHIDIYDTSWDITANTIGGFLGYGLILMLQKLRQT